MADHAFNQLFTVQKSVMFLHLL